MATQSFDATGEPADLEAALSLVPGETYMLQNVDPVASLKYLSAVDEPEASARTHLLQSLSSIFVTPTASETTWVWSDDGSCAVVVSEAE